MAVDIKNDSTNPLITVVVPIFNVEKYLRECVDSILSQVYSNLEIILVDDESPDNSGLICDEYATLDTRIKVIHQKNKGLSGARNAGLEIADGKYITFVDSDDVIEPDMIEVLYKALKDNQAEMAVTGLKSFFEDGVSFSNPHGEKIFVFSREEALDCFLFKDYLTPCVCGKLYDISLWQDIRCPEGKLFEDQYTTYRLVDMTSKIVFVASPKYNYRKRNGSIGHSNFTVRSYDLYYGINEEYDYISHKYPLQCKNIAVGKITWEVVFINMMICAGMNDPDILKKIRRFSRQHFWGVLKCPYIGKVRKIQIGLFSYCYKLYIPVYLKYKERHPMA